jgi:hypothetical protein
MRRLLITEEDKKHILGLYGLLKEDIDPSSGGTVTLANRYKAGYYTTNALDLSTNKTIKNKLDTELVKVTEFVKKYPNSIVSVKFTSQESSLPNTDNEKAGYFKKPDNRLDVGELSGARKEYINQYIQSYFKSLKDQGIIKSEVQIPPVEYVFKPPVKKFMDTKTTTPWCIKGDTQIPKTDTQGYACTGSGYKVDGNTTNNWFNQKQGIYKTHFDQFYTEQNSSIEITVKLVTPTSSPTTTTTTIKTTGDYSECAAGLNIRVWVKTHQCQNAEFFIFANDLLLYNSQGGMTANLNNADNSRGIPRTDSEPLFGPEYLNPGFGYLKNGDGTIGSYGYGKIDESGDLKGSRSDTFKLTKEQSLKLLNAAKGKISLWMIATTTTAHKDIPQVTITKEDGTVVYNKAPKIVQGKLLTLDGCTLQVLEGTDETVPDVTGYVNLIRQERMNLQSQAENADMAKTGNKKQQKKKQATLDSKGKILERASDLVTQMTTFLNYLKPALEKTTPPPGSASMANPGTPEIQSEIDKYYNIFYSGLTYSGTPESPELQLGKDSEGDYINKTVKNDDLFGDIRMYMDQFYEGFNAVYANDEGVLSPTGIRNINSKGVDRGLRGSKILSNIKKLKQYSL